MAGAVEGRNDFGQERFGDDLRRALEDKELASGTLVGTYQR